MKNQTNQMIELAAGEQRLLPNAVVGLVDIISSTQISNAVDLRTEWELKSNFLKAATKRASETGMLVLNHTGDGFLFIANPDADREWIGNLMRFYDLLTADFQRILKSLGSRASHIQSGLRFGVSQGPILVGELGPSSGLTAVGPDVNLAARLGAMAGQNEMVCSSRVWESLKSALKTRVAKHTAYKGLKGFDFEVAAVHMGQELVAPPRMALPTSPRPLRPAEFLARAGLWGFESHFDREARSLRELRRIEVPARFDLRFEARAA